VRVYKQDDGIEFRAWFEARPGEPTFPPSVHWRLRCLTNNLVLKEWAELVPEAVTEAGALVGVRVLIEVDGEYNAIQNAENRRETKQLQVTAAKGTARQKSEFREYAIANGDF
jgi:hypothetical protein